MLCRSTYRRLTVWRYSQACGYVLWLLDPEEIGWQCAVLCAGLVDAFRNVAETQVGWCG